MTRPIVLTDEFLNSADIMPVEGDPTDYITPAVYDIPKEVDVSAGGEQVVFRFVYPDREEPAEAETPLDDEPDIFVRRGRFSGKLMALRAPSMNGLLPAVADRLRTVAPRQKRKNQQLNFLLLSNILRKKQAELLLV